MKKSETMGRKAWLVLGILFVILFALESVVTYRYLVAPHPGANDFYSRWAGARALLVEGRDPYDLAVTREIQKVIKIDPSQVGRGGFHYPLHVTFLFWPLVYLPYTWAQALWQTLLVWVVIAIVIVMLARLGWRLPSLGMAGTVLAAILFYPVARSILLGQFTLHVTLFIAITLWALQKRRDGVAGVFLAATSIKPQMVILLGPWLVLWAISQRRWRFIGGIVGGGLAFLAASMVLFPRWPLSFLEDARRYSQVAGGRDPLLMLLDLLWPGEVGFIRYVAVGLLLLAMFAAWWRARQDNGLFFDLALYWTIAVGLFVFFQTGTTNQALLLIPLLAWTYEGVKRWGVWPVTIALVTLLVTMWVLFVELLSGDYENPLLFLPLPLLTFAILLGIELTLWRTRRERKTFSPSSPPP